MRQKLICIIWIFSICSCENLFHPEEISIGDIKNYNELITATGGVYGKLAAAFTESYVYMVNLKGDDINNNAPNYNGYYGTYEYCWEERYYDEKTYTTWELFYSTVASINNILVQFEQKANLDKPTREVLGEIYFLRAYCYFRLTRTYGEIPFIENNDISYTIAKSSYTRVYEFIEQDLLQAMKLLPSNNTSSRIPYETPHRGTAKILLTEVYLSWAGYPVKDFSMYTFAAREAEEVIDSSGYFGFELMQDFANLWDKDHLYNSEIAFALYYMSPSQTQETGLLNTTYGGRSYEYSNEQCFMTDPESPFLCLVSFCAEVNFYNLFPSNYRKNLTFFSTIYVPSEYYPLDTGYIHIEFVNPCNRIGYRKFLYDPYKIPVNQFYETDDSSFFYFGNPRIYIFRFAQTLLTYAEAAARSGRLNEKAYECVNMIRRRANNVDIHSPSVYDLQPGLSPEAFADSVVWERAWELAGEPEGRWFDLVRLEMVEDLPNLRHPQEGGPPETFDKSAYFFPVPEGDIDLNPNLGE